MLTLILTWFCSLLSIVAAIYYLLEKYYFKNNLIPLKLTLWILIIGGLIAIVLGVFGWSRAQNEKIMAKQAPITFEKIDQIGDREIKGDYIQGDKIVGDTTTSAQSRSVAAFQSIKGEILDNFLHLSTLVGYIENTKPEKFWDLRRANETEPAYQDRARDNFLEYKQFIHEAVAKQDFRFSNTKYQNYDRDFSLYPNPEIVEHVKTIYNHLAQVFGCFENYEDNLSHALKIWDTDQKRTKESILYHKEAFVNSKIHLLNAAANFCLVCNDDTDVEIVKNFLETANINIDLTCGQAGYKTAYYQISRLYKDKQNLIAAKIDDSEKRKVSNRVTDPYLLMVRQAGGLGNVLSEGEISALKKKAINETETDPSKLFKFAANSFMESDGHASAFYYERAIQTEKLPPILEKYARTSIHRLKNPALYGESIGVFVLQLTPASNFAQAKVQEGDVIIALDGKTVNEPMDISTELGQNSGQPVLLGIVRDRQFTKIVVEGGRSAGAALTQLIIFNRQQL